MPAYLVIHPREQHRDDLRIEAENLTLTFQAGWAILTDDKGICLAIPAGQGASIQRDDQEPYERAPVLEDVHNFPGAFGAAVREARTARGWTQAELAAKLAEALGRDVNPLTITRTEAATRPVPFPELAALSALLGLSVDALIKSARENEARYE